LLGAASSVQQACDYHDRNLCCQRFNVCYRPRAVVREPIVTPIYRWNMLKFLLMLFAALVLLPASASPTDIRDVSMIQLIANPERYDGSPIRLIAFMHLEFEGDALYLHREDYEKSLHENAIWIRLTDEQMRTSQKLSGGYVLVEGTFRAKDRGHFGMFAGSVDNIARIQSWERRKK
jgi:hypothetical protein